MNVSTWEKAVLWLRSQPEQRELVRACFYDDPLLNAAIRYTETEEWQAVLRLLPKTKGKVLDIGAGRGISSYALARAGWQVDALEPDASLIVGRGAIQELEKESNLPIRVLDGYAEHIPCEWAQYDLVYGRQVLHHANDLYKMCCEVARVLKPGGMFIATREHVISRREDLAIFLANHPLHKLYGGENAFLLQEYVDSIKSAGLRITLLFGPYDTPINYFPMTHREWVDQIQLTISKRLGRRLTRLLFADFLPWSSSLNSFLMRRVSRRDQTPGRLYSFVAIKC